MEQRLIGAIERLTKAMEISNERYAGGQEERDDNRDTVHRLFRELLAGLSYSNHIPATLVKGFIFSNWPTKPLPAGISNYLNNWLLELGYVSARGAGGVWVYRLFSMNDYLQPPQD